MTTSAIRTASLARRERQKAETRQAILNAARELFVADGVEATTMRAIAAKIGCAAQTLHEWVKKAEVDSGRRVGVPTEVAAQLKALERENRELRQANEILRKASAYFAQAELDRPFKR